MYPEFGKMMTKLARFVRPILSMTPPKPDTLNPAELFKLLADEQAPQIRPATSAPDGRLEAFRGGNCGRMPCALVAASAEWVKMMRLIEALACALASRRRENRK